MLGVAIFSGFIGTFIDIVLALSEGSVYDDAEKLERFMNVMKFFNASHHLPHKLEKQIYEFFKYKWEHDKNMAICDESDKSLLDQLPEYVQDNLYVGFLFKDFLTKYKEFFNVSKTMKKGLMISGLNT